MNLPNRLTLLRVLLVPVFMAFMLCFKEREWAMVAGLIVFSAASLTDLLDGKIARSKKLVTTFGKFADPLADKMLTTAAFLVFMDYGFISAWPVFIILVREFAVSGIRLAAAADGEVIAAAFFGKLKTVMQMMTIIAGILMLAIPVIPIAVTGTITRILVWISVIFTVASGAEYIIKNRHLLKLK